MRKTDRIVKEIIGKISSVDKERLRCMKPEELIRLHHTFGRWIRNYFHLWGGDIQSLQKETSEMHPDDISMIIIEKVYKKLGGYSGHSYDWRLAEPFAGVQHLEGISRI